MRLTVRLQLNFKSAARTNEPTPPVAENPLKVAYYAAVYPGRDRRHFPDCKTLVDCANNRLYQCCCRNRRSVLLAKIARVREMQA